MNVDKVVTRLIELQTRLTELGFHSVKYKIYMSHQFYTECKLESQAEFTMLDSILGWPVYVANDRTLHSNEVNHHPDFTVTISSFDHDFDAELCTV